MADSIESRRCIRVGAFHSPPLMTGEPPCDVQGALPYLLTEAAALAGMRTKFCACLLSHLGPLGSFDGDAALGLFVAPKREEQFFFSRPLYATDLRIVALSEQHNSANSSLYVKEGDIAWESRLDARLTPMSSNIISLPASAAENAINVLDSTPGSAALVDSITIESLMRSGSFPARLTLGAPIMSVSIALGISRHRPDLVFSLGPKIVEILLSSEFQRIEREALDGWRSLRPTWSDWINETSSAFSFPE